MTELYVVITTIQEPTKSVMQLASKLRKLGASLVVVGDRKGPATFCLSSEPGHEFADLQFLDLNSQLASKFELARMLPVNHYGRKNLGYLQAIDQGAECIYETDDDNAPLSHWQSRYVSVSAIEGESTEWLNVYRYFSDDQIWPRGFPLDELKHSKPGYRANATPSRQLIAPVQQGLANGSPDVDAVWRLVLDHAFDFESGPSVVIPKGTWCPFNSQSTWWWPEAYELMYLPSYCSFRMTDIWRSFIAQRCLWEMGYGVVFHAPEVIQERNKHDLMRDFAEEVDGYLRNKELVNILANLKLQTGQDHQGENLLCCYHALVSANFFPGKEIGLVEAWLSDLENCDR